MKKINLKTTNNNWKNYLKFSGIFIFQRQILRSFNFTWKKFYNERLKYTWRNLNSDVGKLHVFNKPVIRAIKNESLSQFINVHGFRRTIREKNKYLSLQKRTIRDTEQ